MSNESENRRLNRGIAMAILGTACLAVGLDVATGADGYMLAPGLIFGGMLGFFAVIMEFDVRRPYTQHG